MSHENNNCLKLNHPLLMRNFGKIDIDSEDIAIVESIKINATK